MLSKVTTGLRDLKASTINEYNWPISNCIRFGRYVQQAVKIGVSFFASTKKTKISNVFVAMYV